MRSFKEKENNIRWKCGYTLKMKIIVNDSCVYKYEYIKKI